MSWKRNRMMSTENKRAMFGRAEIHTAPKISVLMVLYKGLVRHHAACNKTRMISATKVPLSTKRWGTFRLKEHFSTNADNDMIQYLNQSITN